MKESEQAQTVAENKIRKILYRYRGHIEEEDMDEMIEIVDSQAQKIKEAREIAEQYRDSCFDFDGYDTYESQRQAFGKFKKANLLPWEEQ